MNTGQFQNFFINRDESDAILASPPSGAKVRVRATAANDSGESQSSELKEIILS